MSEELRTACWPPWWVNNTVLLLKGPPTPHHHHHVCVSVGSTRCSRRVLTMVVCVCLLVFNHIVQVCIHCLCGC